MSDGNHAASEAIAARARLETLRQILHGDRSDRLYGVLDGASIASLPEILAEHEASNVCLYRGQLDAELAEVAPYLVRLPPQSTFTELVLQRGWGHHWGILAVSKADMRALRLHFRKFLMVWDPDGKPLYFRYYDPRVLRVYLPTCDAEELRIVFGPVSAYLIEGETPGSLLRFTFSGEALCKETLALSENQST